MNGLRKSSRVNTSTINVKLNDNNEIELLTVNSDEGDDEPEDEEEIIENADGSLSIKIYEKPRTLPLHHICAKCSKVFSSRAVSTARKIYQISSKQCRLTVYNLL